MIVKTIFSDSFASVGRDTEKLSNEEIHLEDKRPIEKFQEGHFEGWENQYFQIVDDKSEYKGRKTGVKDKKGLKQ